LKSNSPAEDNLSFKPASEPSDTAGRGGGIVKHFERFLLLVFVVCLGPSSIASQSQLSPPQTPASHPSANVTLPAGTKVELVLTRPIWALPAKAGDPVYAETSFPTVSGGGMAIPAGTFVLGTIEEVTRPTRRSSRAELEVLFTKIIFANGFVVSLAGGTSAIPAAAGEADAQPETLIAITIQATTVNDLLLDNGAEIEMTLGAPLVLDAKQIALSIPLSHAPQPTQFQSATLCRPTSGTPGTPGTPDTVIPGSPGTPSTTVPGGPGMPDITIPGTPATPDTVIPGMPGSPGSRGTACPMKPMVISCALVQQSKTSSTSQPVAVR
jgi:hypothetical protein